MLYTTHNTSTNRDREPIEYFSLHSQSFPSVDWKDDKADSPYNNNVRKPFSHRPTSRSFDSFIHLLVNRAHATFSINMLHNNIHHNFTEKVTIVQMYY